MRRIARNVIIRKFVFSKVHVFVAEKNVCLTLQFVPGKHKVYSASALNSLYSKFWLNICLKTQPLELTLYLFSTPESSPPNNTQYNTWPHCKWRLASRSPMSYICIIWLIEGFTLAQFIYTKSR